MRSLSSVEAALGLGARHAEAVREQAAEVRRREPAEHEQHEPDGEDPPAVRDDEAGPARHGECSRP